MTNNDHMTNDSSVSHHSAMWLLIAVAIYGVCLTCLHFCLSIVTCSLKKNMRYFIEGLLQRKSFVVNKPSTNTQPNRMLEEIANDR